MQLRDYQEEDVAKLMERNSAGVFNEQRTGKTPTSITYMKRKGVQRLLVVCPSSMCYVWKEEIKRWMDSECIIIQSASKFKREMLTAPVTIVNYENLRHAINRDGVVDDLVKWKPDGLIVDEAHRCKNWKSKNATAIRKFNKVAHRLYLTGTPAPNRQYDIFPLLNFIEPTTFTSYWRFVDEYFTKDIIRTQTGIIEEPGRLKPDKEEELQKLLASISVQRKRKDVMTWLPTEEAPTRVKLPCTPMQKKYIKELEEYFETEDVYTQNILENLTRIRQICASPKILGLRGSSPKMDWLEQYIKDYPEKSILVFTNSKKFLYMISESLHIPHTICGDTPMQQRQDVVSAFQSGSINILLGQTQAIKEGLTLDKADVTIFLDTYPPAADYLQAKDRMVATTPERVKPKEIIHLMMEGTYDQELYQLVAKNVSSTDVLNNYIKYLKRRK